MGVLFCCIDNYFEFDWKWIEIREVWIVSEFFYKIGIIMVDILLIFIVGGDRMMG